MKKLMKKISKSTLLIYLFSILIFCLKVKADSGFDASYDSGGSSSSSSSSSGSGSDGSMAVVILAFYIAALLYILDKYKKNAIRIVLIIISIFITSYLFELSLLDILGNARKYCFPITFVCLSAFSIYFLLNWDSDNNIDDDVDEEYNNLSLEVIKEQLGNDFDVDSFLFDAFKMYYDVQIAWMNNDIESVRDILDDNLFNSYKMQLITLKNKNQKNMMEDINFESAYITNIRKENNKETIDVIMEVSCRDYIIDLKTNKVVRGNEEMEWIYKYKLSFIHTKGVKQIDFCPNCHARLGEGSSVKCDYCGSIINRDVDKFVLIDKKMIEKI